MSEYTPAPWIVDTSRLLASVNSDQKHVAMVNYYNSVEPETRVSESECLANARLIAAAPELLEALEAIEERADECMGEWSSVEFTYLPEGVTTLYELRNAARMAITKAKGK